MSRQSHQHGQELLERATEWYMELRDPDVSDQKVASWQGWLAESNAHQNAFDRVVELMQLSCHVSSDLWPDERELLADRHPDDMPVARWLNHARPSGRATQQRPDTLASRSVQWPWLRTKQTTWAIAGCSLILAVVTGLTLIMTRPVEQSESVYQTTAAEHLEAPLPDGSVLSLGAKSRVIVHYSPELRYLLLEQGEAYFTAARDPSRPFVVVAGNAAIKAIGTSFNINRYRERVIVAVTEGAVSVAPKPDNNVIADMNFDSASPLANRLEKGYQLTLDKGNFTPAITPVDPGEVIAWRSGYHKYRGQSIAQVLQDVNRYKDRPIILSSLAISKLRYSGTVFQDSIDSWLLGLEAVFPITVSETPLGDIIIYAKETE